MKNIPPCHEIESGNIQVRENGDRLIKADFGNSNIIYEPMYYNAGIPGAVKDCYMRESVWQMLLKVVEFLPDGYGLKIFDAWRPFAVQKYLYDRQVAGLCENKGLSPEEAAEEAKLFVSYPEENPLKPFVHATGGAVDLTIIDDKNQELNMGTAFDDFTLLAATDSFEKSSDDEIKNNRRLLYSAMINAGFTNYPAEWWHYDYGDTFWAAEKKQSYSVFGGIYTIQEVCYEKESEQTN